MRRIMCLIVALGGVFVGVLPAQAQSLWERRDPKNAYLFHDYKARQIGDILTIVVNENTESGAQESRTMNKQTLTSGAFNISGSTTGNTAGKKFSGELDAQNQSQRKFDGQANTNIDRKFVDRMSVVVVAVLPNGNLVIEGIRQQVFSRELRTLRVFGLVRPADIGAFNQIESQYIANLRITYEGRGPDTNYTNQGWGGRLMNILWPF